VHTICLSLESYSTVKVLAKEPILKPGAAVSGDRALLACGHFFPL